MAPPRWLLEHGELNLHALGPGSELEAEWAVAGLRLPDRSAIRRYRLERVRQLFGRVLPAHEEAERQRVRSDARLD